MSKLTREDVLKLANLSRLKLTKEEIEGFRGELSAILEYVAKLDDVDVKGLEPTYQLTGLKNVMRADKPIEYSATPGKLLAIAPATDNHQYKVKRVL